MSNAGQSNCPACGAANAQSAKFCTSCGARVATGEIVKPVSPPIEQGFDTPQSPKRGRERTFLYVGIALAILVIAALLKSYPAMILNNDRQAQTETKDDSVAAEAALENCEILDGNLRAMKSRDPSVAPSAVEAANMGIVNGPPRNDEFLGSDFVVTSTQSTANVYNKPHAEKGRVLYNCPRGLTLKGRWVRGGTDGSERWLRIKSSRYLHESVLATNASAGAEAEQLRRSNDAADAASASAVAAANASAQKSSENSNTLPLTQIGLSTHPAPGCLFTDLATGIAVGELNYSSSKQVGGQTFEVLRLGINGREVLFNINSDFYTARRQSIMSEGVIELGPMIRDSGMKECDSYECNSTGNLSVLNRGQSKSYRVKSECWG